MKPEIYFTKSVSAKTRVYHVDVCKDPNGQPYVILSEIPKDKSKERTPRRLVLFPEYLDDVINALDDAADFIIDNEEMSASVKV